MKAWLLTLLAATAAAAQSDPLKTPACGHALAALEAGRADGATAAAARSLRDRAAAVCLGSSAIPSRPARVLQAPLAMPAPVIEPPAPQASHAAAALPPPPVALQRSPGSPLCDPSGCWTEDGGRLRHLGPNLTGRGGPCGTPVAMVYCP